MLGTTSCSRLQNLPLHTVFDASSVAPVLLLYFFDTSQVKSEGEVVCRLESGGFVGSMAFNRFIQETPVPSGPASYAAQGSAFSSSVSQGGHDGSQPDIASDDRHTPSGGGRTMAQAAKEAILDVLRGPSVVGNVAMSLVPDVVDGEKDLSKMERSKYTVTATSDVSTVDSTQQTVALPSPRSLCLQQLHAKMVEVDCSLFAPRIVAGTAVPPSYSWVCSLRSIARAALLCSPIVVH